MDDNNKIVYDCFEISPYYDNLKEPYLDENFAVDLGPIEEQLGCDASPTSQTQSQQMRTL